MSQMAALAHRRLPTPVPADGLLHPVALVALAILLLNDHVLKAGAPSPLTGILSGFAGIVLFPLALQAGSELLVAPGSRWRGPSARVIALACMATGIGYAAVELLPPAAEAYRYGLGALQWLGSAVLALVTSDPLPPVVPVLAISDPWDLLALSALIIPWSVGRARATRG
jgi:hypothetical protein